MKYSTFFPKTRKSEFKDDLSINAKYLIKAGYIDQLMAGSYTLLPLGFKVVENIKQIIREELNKTGAQEVLMPLLHPREIWDQTGRWSDTNVKQIMYQFKDIHEKEYGLSFTHEEVVLDLLRKQTQSYKDFPVKIYHFSTKFRNELRAKSGILRGREFLMKDLYSAHATLEDLEKYYDEVKVAYVRIFEKLGLKVIVTEASGGVFTDNVTHEFQVISEAGEDEIIYCEGGDFAQNVEIAKAPAGKECDLGHGPLKKVKTIEVGNIFNFGQVYSKKMNVTFNDKDGKSQYPYFASYGIGPTRVMGTLVEVFHDEKGIIWPKSVSPFQVYLIGIESPLRQGSEGQARIKEETEKVERKLEELGLEVLNDDREVSVGEKFANADLLGFPYRLVLSAKTHSAGSGQAGDKIEFKERKNNETELLTFEEIISKMQIRTESQV